MARTEYAFVGLVVAASALYLMVRRRRLLSGDVRLPAQAAPVQQLDVVAKDVVTVEESDVVHNLKSVRARMAASGPATATLVAVSKTKPVELLREAYDAGQRDFGENYVQEVIDKARLLPGDIRWHFIGHLQSNKVKDLLKVPNLYAVHTVDTLKLAQELQKRAAALRPPEQRLRVFVQVNTSGEESKSGCAPADCPALCRAVRSSCAALDLIGLMCIGKYSAEEGGSDVDFACLRQCRVAVAGALGLGTPEELAMSMGMSHDFEDALTAGASHVRVGSTIFGARAPKRNGQIDAGDVRGGMNRPACV
jgi:pyridoxal phosphate enzyme (YggS family)